MEQKIFTITNENSKQRLDVFLEKTLQTFTRSHIKNQIVSGQVLVNNKMVKAGYTLKEGDIINITVVEPKKLNLTPQNLGLEIVFEDKNFAVINKPQGLVVHPAVGNYDGTLVNGLLYQVKDLSGINGVIRPGIVHRLDKDTSGLLLVAKNDQAHVNLSKQIKDKTAKRYYLALVNGVVKSDSGQIDTFIARDAKNRLKMAVNNRGVGKQAITLYKVIQRFSNYTLLEFELKTGRTHQIRVHASFMGHSVVGDKLYGSKPDKFNLKGQLLHAYKLEVVSPTDNTLKTFEVPLPDYFANVLSGLK